MEEHFAMGIPFYIITGPVQLLNNGFLLFDRSEFIEPDSKILFLFPVWDQVVKRPEHTETQTKKGRVERWKNMEGKFIVHDPALLQNKRLLLVDDVVTTGATLESCGAELLKIPGVQLSIATLCIATR